MKPKKGRVPKTKNIKTRRKLSTKEKTQKRNTVRKLTKKHSNVKVSSRKRKMKPIDWEKRAYQAGRLFALQREDRDTQTTIKEINKYWVDWLQKRKLFSWSKYHSVSQSFMQGWFNTLGETPERWVLLPTKKKVAAILTVKNEEETIHEILQELERLPLYETIMVINGSTDEGFSIARKQSKAKILYYHQPLGYDVGRALGASVSQSDMCLFLDGDFPIHAEQFMSYIHAAEKGLDVVLNDVSPYIGLFSGWDEVTRVKVFLNKVLSRSDLKMNSLTAVPHLLTNQAINRIGVENLKVPPVAHAIAISKGLKIGTAGSINVFQKNRHRTYNTGEENPVSEMIIGDHIEALYYMLELEGSRLSYADHLRDRTKVKGIAK